MTTLTSPLPARPFLSLPSALRPLAAFALAYLATSLLLPSIVGGGWNVYVVQPVVWLALARWLYLEGDHLARPSRGVIALAALTGAFQVAAYVLAGLLFGFGESPYAHSLVAVAGNVAYLGSFLVATELTRARLLEGAGRSTLGTVAVTLLLAMAMIPLGRWQALSSGIGSPFAFGGEQLLPATAQSWLATLLVGLGGPWAAVVYRGVLLASEWLSPVLPALSWTQSTLVSIVAPAIAAVALHQASRTEPDVDVERRGVPGWLVAATFVVAGVVWLNTGLLGVRPAVISGISMEPTLVQGDIVITRTVAPAALQRGDVIRFVEGGVPVLHRVRQVTRGPGGISIVTQGDNNAYPDAPIGPEAVQGRLVFKIPKLGLIPITVRHWLGR